MSLNKKLGMFAIALWIVVAVLAYTNTWVSDTQLLLAAHSEHHQSNDPYYGGKMEQWDVQVPAQYADVFPHDRLITTIYITIGIATVITLIVLGVDFKDEKKEKKSTW